MSLSTKNSLVAVHDIYTYAGRENLTWKRILSDHYNENTIQTDIRNYMDKNGIFYIVNNDVAADDICAGDRTTFLSRSAIPGPLCRMVFAQGKKEILDMPLLGVVGPRKMSAIAARTLDQVIAVAKYYHLAIVSGGAQGVDRYIHEKAMREGIPCLVVLGGGIVSYQQSTSRGFLEHVIQAGGLIISEFKLWEQPQKYTFPLRNRLIAGLSHVLFVPEAGPHSGSLITLRYASTIGKPVYTLSAGEKSQTNILDTYVNQGMISGMMTIDELFQNHFFLRDDDMVFSGGYRKCDRSVHDTPIPQSVSSVGGYLAYDVLRQLGIDDIE